MNTIEELAEWFQKNKITCNIFYRLLGADEWQVICEKKDDGIELKVRSENKSLYIAMYDAYEKFQTTAFRGAGNLLAPMIEHKTLPSDTPLYEHQPLAKDNNNGDLDDDIPF